MKVLKLTNVEGNEIALAGDKFEVTTAGVSNQWHGARAAIRVVGGTWYSVRNSVQEICAQMEKHGE